MGEQMISLGSSRRWDANFHSVLRPEMLHSAFLRRCAPEGRDQREIRKNSHGTVVAETRFASHTSPIVLDAPNLSRVAGRLEYFCDAHRFESVDRPGMLPIRDPISLTGSPLRQFTAGRYAGGFKDGGPQVFGKIQHIHFVGIGGIGMSGIARCSPTWAYRSPAQT